MPEAMDKYYGLRYAVPATLLDHLTSPIFVLDEVGGIRDAQKATEFRRGEELTGLLEEGVICPGWMCSTRPWTTWPLPPRNRAPCCARTSCAA